MRDARLQSQNDSSEHQRCFEVLQNSQKCNKVDDVRVFKWSRNPDFRPTLGGSKVCVWQFACLEGPVERLLQSKAVDNRGICVLLNS